MAFKTVLEALFLLGFGQSEQDWVRSASFYFSVVLFALVVGWAGRGDAGVQPLGGALGTDSGDEFMFCFCHSFAEEARGKPLNLQPQNNNFAA